MIIVDSSVWIDALNGKETPQTSILRSLIEQKLIGQADELIVLADSSKFATRSSLLLCPLNRIHTVITDDGIEDRAAQMLEAADIRLIVTTSATSERKGRAQHD